MLVADNSVVLVLPSYTIEARYMIDVFSCLPLLLLVCTYFESKH